MDEKRGYVYAMRFNPTGKFYVGSSNLVERRIKFHLHFLKNGNHPVENLQRDFDKYGCDISYFVLSEAINESEARNQEKLFMTILQTRNPAFGYNYKDHTFDFDLSRYKEYKLPIEPPRKRPGPKPKRGDD